VNYRPYLVYCCGNLRNLDGHLVNDQERWVCQRQLTLTKVSAFKLCSVNIHVGRKRCTNAVKTCLLQWSTVSFVVIHSITKTMCLCLCFDGNKFGTYLFEIQFNYSLLFPSIPSSIIFLFCFIIFFFLLVHIECLQDC
jgi:hypothetical protein